MAFSMVLLAVGSGGCSDPQDSDDDLGPANSTSGSQAGSSGSEAPRSTGSADDESSSGATVACGDGVLEAPETCDEPGETPGDILSSCDEVCELRYRERWRYAEGEPFAKSTVGTADGTSYVLADSEIRRYGPTGELLWSLSEDVFRDDPLLAALGTFSPSARGVVVAGSRFSDGPFLAYVDGESQEILWEAQPPEGEPLTVLGAHLWPGDEDQLVYTARTDLELSVFSLDASGVLTAVGSLPVGPERNARAPIARDAVAAADGRVALVYERDARSHLILFGPDGVLAEITTPEAAGTPIRSVHFTSDGRLLATERDAISILDDALQEVEQVAFAELLPDVENQRWFSGWTTGASGRVFAHGFDINDGARSFVAMFDEQLELQWYFHENEPSNAPDVVAAGNDHLVIASELGPRVLEILR